MGTNTPHLQFQVYIKAAFQAQRELCALWVLQQIQMPKNIR